MALSFFGRKPARAAPATGSPTVMDDQRSDLSSPPTELSGLDFTRTDTGRGLARVAGMVEVFDHGDGIGAAFEEAAVLYANAKDADAEQVLAAVLDDPHAQCGEGLWMMMLDLLRLRGQRAAFDRRAAAYAAHFARALPLWADLSARPEPALPPRVNLAGKLSARADVQLARITGIARARGAVRISLAKVRDADAAGSALLRKVVHELASEGIAVTLLDVDAFAAVLASRLCPGWAEEENSWLLLLDLLQHSGERARFDDLAADYARTFATAQPQWQDAAAVAPAALPATEEFRFEGELAGAANDTLQEFAAFATAHERMRIDCATLRRLDFVCAGALFNVLATLRAQGKRVTLYNVNAMVAALLRIMSVDQVAHVTLRH